MSTWPQADKHIFYYETKDLSIQIFLCPTINFANILQIWNLRLGNCKFNEENMVYSLRCGAKFVKEC